MATEQHQENTEKVADKGGGGRGTDGIKEGQSTRQKESTPIFSPPSASSSPSHEFSFTISLHPSSTVLADKTKSTPSFAIDLSPADDIFFHGHLLPLHLLSHFPISPRSSTNSADGYNPPIRDLSEDGKSNNSINSKSSNNDINGHNTVNKSNSNDNNNNKSHGGTSVPKVRSKPKSFSLFGLAKWRKGCEVGEKEDKDEEKKRKLRFEVSHMLKRYVRMVRPLLFFRGGGRDNRQVCGQAYSFSGNLTSRGKPEWRGRREFSAPASMWTSPTNSGHLVAKPTFYSSTSDSTMEELQNAIQAAITHCKNSIAVKEEKIKC